MRSVFIVDDHRDTADFLATLFYNQGFSVLRFYDYESAYYAIGQSEPCMAILDLNVPGSISASQFVERARRKYPHLKVVLMTGDSRQVAARHDEDVTVLLKPFTNETVLKLAENVCRRNPTPAAGTPHFSPD